MFIIGITGKLHSGKDTVAEYLVENLPKAVKRSFADALKEIGMNVFGFSMEQMYDQKEKEVVDPFWGVSGRKWCQDFGTILRECYDVNVWVRIMEKYVCNHQNDCSVLIIPDVRYDNEADFILQHEGIVLKVNRNPDSTVDEVIRTHTSENGIAFSKISLAIDNNGTFDDLYKQLDKLIKEFQPTFDKFIGDDFFKGETVFNTLTGRYEIVSYVKNGYVYTEETSPEGTSFKDVKRTIVEPFPKHELFKYLGECLVAKRSDKKAIVTEISDETILIGSELCSYDSAANNYTLSDGSPFGNIKIYSR